MTDKGKIETYLFFAGNCLQAVNFYAKVWGIEPVVMRYKEDPTGGKESMVNPEWIMHASLQFGSTLLMMSDDFSGEVKMGENFMLSWTGESVDEVKRVWNAFVEAGAEVDLPLGETFWSPLYGMLKDQFGVGWMFQKAAPPAAA